MRYVLYILSVVALLYGAGASLAAKSAIHEIQAGVAFIVFAVLVSGGAVIGAIERMRKALPGAPAEPDPKRYP